MSAFVKPCDTLNAELIKDEPATWRLLSPLVYQSDVAGQTFTVPAGFVTDLASTPRLPFVYELGGGVANMASVIHDFLYTTHPVQRSIADAVLKEASILTGVAKWRAWAMYLGVRIGGGGSHWNGPATAA
jgi:Protein of unknown function (DUF1353)